VSIEHLITEHLDIWTAADTEKKSGRGRGSANSGNVYGIKKLRELILELAVRGKLVSQDPNDEPASELLKRIQAEKAKLIAEGNIKKEKPLAEITEEEKPFELPVGWEWVRLSEIVSLLGDGIHGTPNYDNYGEFFFINGNNLADGIIELKDQTKRVSFDEYQKYKKELNEKSILVSINGTIGNVAFYNSEKIILGKSACYFNLLGNIDKQYIKKLINSDYFLRYAFYFATGTTIKNVSLKTMRELPVPLPSFEEQHRIVAKVDELMALCAQLENQHNNAAEAHEKLVAHLLGTLTQSQNAEDFNANWQRIAEHFDALFTTEASIDELKQTLLQLAVMGKLVPQDPNDEPASELLKRIQAEKAKLIAEGKIKKDKPLAPITMEEKPFELPVGWEWVRLNDLASLITKGSSPKWQGVNYTDNFDDVMFVTSENVGSYKLLLDSPKFVERKFNEIEPRSILKNGDFLMNIVGASIGRTAVYDIDVLANINQAVCLIRISSSSILRLFLLHFFNSETCLGYMFDKQVDNARPNLSMGNIAKFLIPIPPIVEQHRIVAKVDELMAICDQLKTRITEANELQRKIADVVVENAI
jgi:type I restriction enzyme S subunit